jgi:membrane-bound lytic murein transglycosylase A
MEKTVLEPDRRCPFMQITEHASRRRRPLLRWTVLGLALLAGCAAQESSKSPAVSAARATYILASWDALPAVSDSDLQAGFSAWRSACGKLRNDAIWGSSCSAALVLPDTPSAIRSFMRERLDAYGLRSADGSEQGLITGYYEPIYQGSSSRSDKATVPVYGVPDDLIVVSLDSVYPELKGKRLRGRIEGRRLKPYDDAATIASKGAKAEVLAWLNDPMDLQFLQIQGSGRIQLADGRQLRLGYADQNGYPYRAIGRWLVQKGELKQDAVTMGSIRAWAQAHPTRIQELLASNPSYVFFTRRPDGNEGPQGSLGVPLTAGYSIAVDRRTVPLGSMVWLSTTRPDGSSLVRPVAAQDTGGAITGNVRADLFWGTGDAAGSLAGDMKQQGRLWLLWPKGAKLPDVPDAGNAE